MKIQRMDRAGTILVALYRPTDAETQEELEENTRIETQIRVEVIKRVKPLLPEGWKADIDGTIVGTG